MSDSDATNPNVNDAVDDQGVDRSSIRELLALSPWERLLRLENLVESILRVREANGIRSVP